METLSPGWEECHERAMAEVLELVCNEDVYGAMKGDLFASMTSRARVWSQGGQPLVTVSSFLIICITQTHP